MADQNGPPPAAEEPKNTTGRTWPDLIAELTTGAPIWVISGAALGFVGIVAYSAFVMDECRTLAFLGETGACGDRPAPAVSGLPTNAVVAFASECPKEQGWVRYKEAAARFIIGAATFEELEAGSSAFRDGSNEEPLTERPLGEPNGTEMVKLNPDQMPEHDHVVTYRIGELSEGGQDRLGGTSDQSIKFAPRDVRTKSAGGEPNGSTKPHYNMPPYIALYFCKKEAG